MKKIVKIISLFLIFVLCIACSSCVNLDELRSMRASVTETGTILLADGTEYKLLPVCEEFSPNFENDDLIYVVEDDVPLLLMDAFGDWVWKSEDGKFLKGSIYEYYCRADLYDELCQRMEAGFVPDTYGYWYYDDEEGQRVFYTLTQEQADAVAWVYGMQTPEILPEAVSLRYTHKVDLYLCTQDALFKRETVDLCQYQSKYYVVGSESGAIALYPVPEELSTVFASIFAPKIESETSGNEVW